MKLIMNFLALLAISDSPLILAANVPYGLSSTSMEGYTIGRMTFEGTLGGHQVQLNGSVEEIHAQMKKLYPDFDPDSSIDSINHTLAVRDVENKTPPPVCYPVPSQSWQRAETFRIDQGDAYLRGLNGLCGVGAHSCVRVSCSYDSAIYLCNDNDYTITPSCTYIASYSQDIINHCNYQMPIGQPNARSWFVCGQEFDTDRYNVIVRKDKC